MADSGFFAGNRVIERRTGDASQETSAGMSQRFTVQRLLNGENPEFAHVFNSAFVEISRVIAREFYGDLHLFLVFAAIANQSVARTMADERTAKAYGSFPPIGEQYDFIKLLPLSDIVGLPRTTVRRKVERLVDLRYIEHRRGSGYRVLKGAVGQSPRLSEILKTQFTIIVRLFNQMLRRDMIGVAPNGG
jgi:hypothetical protein